MLGRVLHLMSVLTKQSATKWNRRKESRDSLDGKQRVMIPHNRACLFDIHFTNLFHFCSSKGKGLLRMKETLSRNEHSALRMFTTALNKPV